MQDSHAELSSSIIATEKFTNGPAFDKRRPGTHVTGTIAGDGINTLSQHLRVRQSQHGGGGSTGHRYLSGKICGSRGCFRPIP